MCAGGQGSHGEVGNILALLEGSKLRTHRVPSPKRLVWGLKVLRWEMGSASGLLQKLPPRMLARVWCSHAAELPKGIIFSDEGC